MSQETLIDRMIFAADWLDQPPPPSNPPPGTSLPKMLREAAVEIADWQASSESYRLDADKLRAALKLGRQCVVESFDYVKTADDQYLADARLRDIDAALADEQKADAS